MKGFFSVKETQSASRPDGKTLSCASCGLYRNAAHPKTRAYGGFDKKILVIGEAWGGTENRVGKPWQSTPGRILKRALAEFDIDLFEDCLSIDAVNCYPGEGRKPNNYEIECCRVTLVEKEIKKYKPKLILLLGESALYGYLSGKLRKDAPTISKWRGFCISDVHYQAWVCPVFHPAQMERASTEIQAVWVDDLTEAIKCLKKPVPKYVKPAIVTLDELDVFYDIPEGSNISFDYETTGIKPHAKGHRIVCASVAVNEGLAYAFMMPKTKKGRQPFIDLLTNPKIGKMAHNMKFEHAWTVERLKCEVHPWVWDSMLAAHILDNRPGICGLKFQSFIQFGEVDYSSEISPWLQSDGKDGNGINKIEELVRTKEGESKLLHYCALDTIYQYRLASIQQSIINSL